MGSKVLRKHCLGVKWDHCIQALIHTVHNTRKVNTVLTCDSIHTYPIHLKKNSLR